MKKMIRPSWEDENFLDDEFFNPADGYFKNQLEEVEPQLEAYAVDLDRKIQRLVREREHLLRQIRWIRETLGESNAQ